MLVRAERMEPQSRDNEAKESGSPAQKLPTGEAFHGFHLSVE